MKTRKKASLRADLLRTALSLCAAVLGRGQAAAAATPAQSSQPAVYRLAPDAVTALMASRGSLSGNVKRHWRSANAVYGFESPRDTVTWTVVAPREDDYAVGVLFSVDGQVRLEVRAGDSVLAAASVPKTWANRPFFWRQELPGTLHLRAGENRVVFRLPDARPPTAAEREGIRRSPRFGQGVTKAFHLFSVELGTPAARRAQVERARAIRGDASWMIAGKYGLFVHFSAMSYPFRGNQRRAAWFQKSVAMFDVKAFADAVERTGAAWVTFTATHQGFYWPGPNAALDSILRGRTTERDLLGEIIDELARRGIRTLFYLHTGYNGYESEFWKAAGAADPDPKRFSDNIAAILRDCSLRYGKKLCGFGYIDGALSWIYPLNPSWEDWARAIKAGNPDAVVGFSSNRGPTVSPFSELAVTDSGAALTRPDPQLIGPGRQLGEVTPAVWCLMDAWFFNKPLNGKFPGGPRHSTQEYVDYFKQMAAAGIPVTINMAMTADVTAEHPIFNPKCMAVMEEIRKAIRGK